MSTDPDRLFGAGPTTRRGLFRSLGRRAAESLPAPAFVGEQFDEEPPEAGSIEPFLADDAFLADVEQARDEPGLHIWWLGQSGFLVQIDGEHLVLDPYLSDSLTEKYAGTDTPHERDHGAVVGPERLAFVDVVTSSHHHGDHLDAGTLPHILAGSAAFVCAAGSRAGGR